MPGFGEKRSRLLWTFHEGRLCRAEQAGLFVAKGKAGKRADKCGFVALTLFPLNKVAWRHVEGCVEPGVLRGSTCLRNDPGVFDVGTVATIDVIPLDPQ